MIRLQREAVFAEMGVAVKEDGDTVGVFSPKKVAELIDSVDLIVDQCFLKKIDASFGESERRPVHVRVPPLLHQGRYYAGWIDRGRHPAGHPTVRPAHP